MKKILAAILAAAMVMSFAACGDSSSKSDSSSKTSSSSAADSSKADSSKADSSSTESTVDASSFAGAWTVSKVIKEDGTEVSPAEYAEQNGISADELNLTVVFKADGTYTDYKGTTKSGEGTFTVSGNVATKTESKTGDTENCELNGDTIKVTSSSSKDTIVCAKNASFTEPANGGEQPAEDQPAEDQPAEDQPEENGEEQAE